MPKMFKGLTAPHVADRLINVGWPRCTALIMADYMVADAEMRPPPPWSLMLHAARNSDSRSLGELIVADGEAVQAELAAFIANNPDLSRLPGARLAGVTITDVALALLPSQQPNDEREGMPPKWDDRDGSDPVSGG